MKCLPKKYPVIVSGLILPWFKGRIKKAVVFQKLKQLPFLGGKKVHCSRQCQAMAGKTGTSRAVALMGRSVWQEGVDQKSIPLYGGPAGGANVYEDSEKVFTVKHSSESDR